MKARKCASCFRAAWLDGEFCFYHDGPTLETPVDAEEIMPRALTLRQLQLLNSIRNYIAAHRYPPTIRELCDLLGVRSTNGVAEQLRALEKKGAIRRDRRTSRGIVVIEKGGA